MSGVFLSYSHRDESCKERLENYLKPFEALEGLRIYSDSTIGVGDRFRERIKQAITMSPVAVLFLSADFLSSTFIVEEELPLIRERHQTEGLQVVPVLVEHCLWNQIPWLKELQIRPWNAVPLADMSPIEQKRELVKIAVEILSLTRSASVPAA